MKLNPKYSFEYNAILNPELDVTQLIENFASLISDKDRFLSLVKLIEYNSDFIEKTLGCKLPGKIDFYIVRTEKFKSFSEPVTIEYSILPEEMLLYLFKEVVKVCINARFPDEKTREEYVNAFVDYVLVNGDFGKKDFVKYGKNLHEYSKENYDDYEYKDIDFCHKSLKRLIEEMYE